MNIHSSLLVVAVIVSLGGSTLTQGWNPYGIEKSGGHAGASNGDLNTLHHNNNQTEDGVAARGMLREGDGFLGDGSSSRAKSQEWDVQCGNGLCSRSDPLCCGYGREYCIPGGQKCCSGTAVFMGDRNNIASCGMDQECCQGGSNEGYVIDCCNKTQTCYKGRCHDDVCSNTTNQDYCLASPQCSWCCYENKCQQKSKDGNMQCGTTQVQGLSAPAGILIPPRRTDLSQPQCNPCNLQTTCDSCVAFGRPTPSEVSKTHGGTEDEEPPTCTWCAQTQSCWPYSVVQENYNFCNNDQTAQTDAQCHAIGPTGQGLHIAVHKANNFGTIVLGTFAFTVLAILALGVFRYVMFRRRMREWLAMMDPNADFGAASRQGAKRELCKKFGFKPTADEKDEKKKKDKSETDGDSETDEEADKSKPRPLPAPILESSSTLVACLACNAATKLPVPKTEAPPIPPPRPTDEDDDEGSDKEKESKDEAEDGEGSKASQGNTEEEEETKVAEDNEPDATIADLMGDSPGAADERRPAPSTAGATQGGSRQESEGGPREMIIALPCYHHLCIDCGRRIVEEGRRKQAAKVAEEKAKKEAAAAAKQGKKKGGSKDQEKKDDDDSEGDQNSSPSTALLINSPGPTNSSSAAGPGATGDNNIAELQLECPKCNGPVECIILPSKIIHN